MTSYRYFMSWHHDLKVSFFTSVLIWNLKSQVFILNISLGRSYQVYKSDKSPIFKIIGQSFFYSAFSSPDCNLKFSIKPHHITLWSTATFLSIMYPWSTKKMSVWPKSDSMCYSWSSNFDQVKSKSDFRMADTQFLNRQTELRAKPNYCRPRFRETSAPSMLVTDVGHMLCRW